MTFRDDNGGFAFACNDAKFSVCVSTWNTRLSQLGKMDGCLRIMTHHLPNLDYIAKIINKRPIDIFIIANEDARDNAQMLKNKFPNVHIALHPNMNAKVVLIAPETVWVSSSDFGKTKMLESTIGLHSKMAHDKALKSLFQKEWSKSTELEKA
ncbi:hypothetical protein [Psychromonas sp. Urea-02u-13]|uniref:hypothetical protein n=1 Tax=Psychromonas sp. Urea-02u-13 TaxID=2058326 RepID=UPI000C33BBFE|nr:hypothetical protein [Psychromonas sp. Urea-02u-13]PKG37004.1 hypothetical protein CXF74_21170 [Psychromonas sp. Urea-02u-13]